MKGMEKREKILSEAEKLFSQKGYYGLSLSELFKRCDIPKGSFYYYFPEGKIQLIQETLRYSYEKMAGRIAMRFQAEDRRWPRLSTWPTGWPRACWAGGTSPRFCCR